MPGVACRLRVAAESQFNKQMECTRTIAFVYFFGPFWEDVLIAVDTRLAGKAAPEVERRGAAVDNGP